MVLFYATEKNRVVETLEAQLADYKVSRCRSLTTMVKMLRKPRHGLEVALIVVNDIEEMIRISEIQNLVRDMRIVVVLPRHDEELVAWGHKLAPRFIAYADNGFEQVGAVLEKMMVHAQKRHARARTVGAS